MAIRKNKAAWWILVVILAVCFQLVFVFAENRPSATKTAIAFTRAYFMLDSDMGKYMSGNLLGNDEDASPVTAYLQAAAANAKARGFEIGMVRQTIEHVEIETLARGADSATIQVSGMRRTSINPIFTYVARLFHLGQTHPFEETLQLVKKDGKWKVCGVPYGMFPQV
jgi:hypothetical protein